MSSEQQAYARRLLSELETQVTEEALEAIICHLDGVLEANTRLNLTRIEDPMSAVRLHVADSLVALREVRCAPAGPLCDIGSGGGYPGVPLAIAAGRNATLLDSVAKKADAVAGIVARCCRTADVRAVAERAEDYARNHLGEYAVVVARAVAPLPCLVELAAPLLMTDGCLVALKGSPTDQEVASGNSAAALVGLSAAKVRSVKLPDGGEQRTILCYTRVGESQVALPRRVGMAQKRPLA